MEVTVNYLAVLVSAIAAMVVGFLWYGFLFRTKWMTLMGYTPESMSGMKMSPNMAYLLQFVASLVMAVTLGYFIDLVNPYFQNSSALEVGACIGFLAWLGFVAPVTVGSVLWENRPWSLWFINASSYLVTLVAMGIILSVWGK